MSILKHNRPIQKSSAFPNFKYDHPVSAFHDPVDPTICGDVPVLIEGYESDMPSEFEHKIGITSGDLKQVNLNTGSDTRLYEGKISFPGYRTPVCFNRVELKILNV